MDQDFIMIYENGQFQSEIHVSEFSREEAFPKINRLDENGKTTEELIETQVKTLRVLFLSKEFDMVDDSSKAYFIDIKYYDKNDNFIKSVLLGPSGNDKKVLNNK